MLSEDPNHESVGNDHELAPIENSTDTPKASSGKVIVPSFWKDFVETQGEGFSFDKSLSDEQIRVIRKDATLPLLFRKQLKGSIEHDMSYQDVLPMAVDKFLQKKSHISNDYREEIIGDNDRVPVGIDYPFKCIALLKITDHLNRTFPGTGFFISERCLITAGHCVYPDGQWAKKIEVIPAAKGQKRPYGSSIESRFRTVRGYINKEGDGQGSEYDYGAIILKNDHFYKQIQAYLGYELIREPIPEDQLELKLSGYAFDTYQIQHQSVGRIEEIETRRIFYDLDTEKGNSGSPLYRGRNGAPIRVTGIHTHGDKTKKVNSGVRLTTGSMKRWNEWSQIN